jgi:FAD dependent oxidoreductase
MPERSGANNLVPVHPSASHVAFGSVRMEPTLMLLGSGAGVLLRRRRDATSPPSTTSICVSYSLRSTRGG